MKKEKKRNLGEYTESQENLQKKPSDSILDLEIVSEFIKAGFPR